jgi:tetratricopeptide (TPR) repeat protein
MAPLRPPVAHKHNKDDLRMKQPPPNPNNRRIAFALLFGFALFAVLLSLRPPAPPAPPSSSPLFGTEQIFAFADPKGTLPLDKLIRKRQDSVKKHPQKVDLWILLGRAWVMKARSSGDAGFYINAQACATLALQREPRNPLALTLQGLALINNHEFEKARDLANDILQRHPEDQLALAILSDAQLELGRYKEALDAAQKMMNYKPNLPSYSRMSYLAWLSGRTTDAKELMRKAIDAGRSSRDREPGTWALLQAALYFWHEGDYEGALAGTQMALRYFPDYAPALVTHSRVLLSLQRYKEAAQTLTLAMSRSPQAQTAMFLGDAYSALQQTTDALQAYKKAETLARQTDLRTLALLLANQNRQLTGALDAAKAEYSKRQDIYTLDAYAWVLHRTGQSLRARQLIEQAMHLNTPDALLWYHAGLIYLACGNTQKGRSFLLRAQKQHPHLDPFLSRETSRALRSFPSNPPHLPPSPTSRPLQPPALSNSTKEHRTP